MLMLLDCRKSLVMVVVIICLLLLHIDGNPGPDDGEASRLLASVVAAAAAAAENTEIGAEVERLSSSETREGKNGRKSGRERKWL